MDAIFRRNVPFGKATIYIAGDASQPLDTGNLDSALSRH